MTAIMKIAIEPKMLVWARQRAKLDLGGLIKRFPKLRDWENGAVQPSLKQLEAFAKITHAPIGMLFLPVPPLEQLPIPDFRTMGTATLLQPSIDLLETIYICQERQAWYQDYMRMQGEASLDYVGSVKMGTNVVKIAETIRQFLDFDLLQRGQIKTWEEALRLFKAQIENKGILVMSSGVVGNNNRRKLDPQEFRGFALVDKFAPLIFVNSNDTKSAQMFTLAHELAHVWIGKSGVSDSQVGVIPDQRNNHAEYWCNQVASELLVPLSDLEKHYHTNVTIEELARRYKVSTLVVLRRIYDLGKINRETLWDKYRDELARLKKIASHAPDGGDFYRTLFTRSSKRFVNAIVANTLEGQTLFRDAFKMLGIKKSSIFYSIAEKLRT